MRRLLVPVSIVSIMLLGLFATVRLDTTAQESTSATAESAFVGAWRFTDLTLGTPSLGNFMADGNFVLSNLPTEPLYEGANFNILLLSTGHGVWEATGDNTADFTFSYLYVNDRGEYESVTTISGTFELAPDGQTLSGEIAFEVRQPEGTIVHASRGMLEGTRINIIPMDQLVPADGTPDATPAA